MLKLVKVSPKYANIFLSALNEYKTDTAKFGLDSMRQLLKTVEEGNLMGILAGYEATIGGKNHAAASSGIFEIQNVSFLD